MVKGNKAIPHIHLRKHWNPNSSQKGNIKVWLAQPKKKESRRRKRQLKAKKMFPRPVKLLRPQVNCPTVRYNMKKRLGRGFTAEELHAAGVRVAVANNIGIRVDRRRKNISEEGLSANVQRLKQYMSKLVLFPLNTKKAAKKGEASADERKMVSQDRTRWGTRSGVTHPAVVVRTAEAPRKRTAEEGKAQIYKFLKKNHSAVRFASERLKREKKKAEKKAEAEKKAAKA